MLYIYSFQYPPTSINYNNKNTTQNFDFIIVFVFRQFHVQPQQQPQPQQLAMGYNIEWIFQRLRCPSGLWYIASQIAITAVGLFAKFVLGKYR